jgi:hypothetical protein
MQLLHISGKRIRMEYLTCKINEFKRNNRNKYIRNMYICTHGFQKVKEHRTNFVTEENADVLVDSHRRHPVSVKY